MALVLLGGVMTGCVFVGSLKGAVRVGWCCLMDSVMLTCCTFGLS